MEGSQSGSVQIVVNLDPEPEHWFIHMFLCLTVFVFLMFSLKTLCVTSLQVNCILEKRCPSRKIQKVDWLIRMPINQLCDNGESRAEPLPSWTLAAGGCCQSAGKNWSHTDVRLNSVLGIRIRMFLGFADPDPLVTRSGARSGFFLFLINVLSGRK